MEGLLILVFVGIAIAVLANASLEPVGNPIYLDVPFPAKDEAKRLGAKWDADRKKWYVPAGKDSAPFAKWMSSPEKSDEVIFLDVPFEQKDEAKELGARWNPDRRRWYIIPQMNRHRFIAFMPLSAANGASPIDIIKGYRDGPVDRRVMEAAFDLMRSLERNEKGDVCSAEEYKANCDRLAGEVETAEWVIRKVGEQLDTEELETMQAVFYSIIHLPKYQNDPELNSVAYHAMTAAWHGIGDWRK